MPIDEGIPISIVIATKGRVDNLARLLESLDRVTARDEIGHEVIIANNATDESLACRVDDLVKQFPQARAGLFRVLRVDKAGKALATNSAISLTEGSLIAFLDDDVAVAPGWLRAVSNFFRDYSFEAMQGTILLPPEAEKDPELQRLYQRYRTICLFPPRPTVQEIKTLTGANMAVRKHLFDQIGLFDVRLGPGQSGTSDDTELAERIIDAGGRIGCAPEAAVYHDVDWNRLTKDYFRFRHEQQGRSRLIYKKPSTVRIAVDLARSMVAFVWHAVLNHERKKYRAIGRCYHYRAMLREKLEGLTIGRHGINDRRSTARSGEDRPVLDQE
jgi:GT2 family glycosyltransferase